MISLSLPSSVSKQECYSILKEQIYEILSGETDSLANLANISALLYHSLPEINWVGFYLRKGQELVLGPFQGKPACTRIPIGKGVCGTAALKRETIIVDNVHTFPGHIACDPHSASEIVLPLLSSHQLLGVLDIDSPILSRFDKMDQQELEHLIQIGLPFFEQNQLELNIHTATEKKDEVDDG